MKMIKFKKKKMELYENAKAFYICIEKFKNK